MMEEEKSTVKYNSLFTGDDISTTRRKKNRNKGVFRDSRRKSGRRVKLW
jgi:hypothetical protein